MEISRRWFTCLIPFYNESLGFLKTLAVLKNVPQINQIICVDDGSKNNLSKEIGSAFPDITLIRLPENLGKSGAVEEGLSKVTNEYILLLDADLENLRLKEVGEALNIFTRETRLDSLILQNKGDNYFIDHYLLRKDIVFSGKRVVSKKDLAAVLNKKPKRFQLELAINIYQMGLRRNVAWTANSAYNPHKVRKMGLIKGAFFDIRNDFHLFSYAGVLKYYYTHLTPVCSAEGGEKRIRWVYTSEALLQS